MRFFLISLISLFILQGCASPGPSAGKPWDRNAWEKQAETAPKNLDMRDQWLPGAAAQAQTPGAPPLTINQSADATLSPGMAPAFPISSSAPVKVAVLVPLSGNSADVGEAILNAAQLALFDIGGNSFELIPRDTKGTAAGAYEAAEAVIHEGAQLILGPLFAEEVRAASPVAAATSGRSMKLMNACALSGCGASFGIA